MWMREREYEMNPKVNMKNLILFGEHKDKICGHVLKIIYLN